MSDVKKFDIDGSNILLKDKFSRDRLDIIDRRTRKQLTSSDLTNLKTAISSANFTGLDIKDGDTFFGQSNLKYTLGQFNFYKGNISQYAVLNENHYAVVVDCMGTTPWNSAGNTNGGYKSSTLRTYLRETVLPKVIADMQALGFNVLTHQCLESNAMDSARTNRFGQASGAASEWEWILEQICALSEPNIYGCSIASSSFYDVGEANRQLNCFREHSFMDIVDMKYLWLKELSSAGSACHAAGNAGFALGEYGAANAYAAFGLILIN